MSANALADLQLDFFLLDSLSDNLWMAPEVHAFSVDAADALSPRNVNPESTFDVDYSETDSWQTLTTDGEPTAQYNTTDRSNQLERTLASRDEHLPVWSADDRWDDEVQDDYNPQVDRPSPDLQQPDYHDDVIAGTRYDSQRQTGNHQPSSWSQMNVTTNKLWTSRLSFLSAESNSSVNSSRRRKQMNPPLTMHYADYIRHISKVSRPIVTSTSLPPPPPPTTTTTTTAATTTSARRRTGVGSRFGVNSPSSRRASPRNGGRRTSTSDSDNECGRRRCPRFRPGVRRQFCQAQFGEYRTNGRSCCSIKHDNF